MRAKRRYDPEFKKEAVRLVVEEGLGVRGVERSLGITYGCLERLDSEASRPPE
jgi:transposase